MIRHTLDARRLLCPLPVIRTQNKVEELSAGDLLEVTASDPGVKNDIPAWCRINGHKVVEIREQPGEIVVVVEVGGEAIQRG